MKWPKLDLLMPRRRPRGFLVGLNRLMGARGRPMNAVESTLNVVGLKGLASNVAFMLHPAGRPAGMERYLYTDGGRGADITYESAVISSAAYETYAVHTDGRVFFHAWWDRVLTAGEQAAFDSATFKAYLAAQYAADAADITVTNAAYSNTGYAFVMTVNTALAGSASDTFVLPTLGSGTYNYEVSWGNGVVKRVTANTDQTYQYPGGAGTYNVAIRGIFPSVYFNGGGDKAKVTALQIGDVGWTSMQSAFYGCSALASAFGTGAANTQNVTDMSHMFRACTTFNKSVAGLNTAKVTNMAYMFWGCAAFNQSVAGFDTSKVTDMSYMFTSCNAFNQSLAGFDTSKVTSMAYMLYDCTVFKRSLATFNMVLVADVSMMLRYTNINDTGTTTNYDATLVAWAAQDLVDSLSIHVGDAKYSDTGQTARAAIATDDSWTFTDGGHI